MLQVLVKVQVHVRRDERVVLDLKALKIKGLIQLTF
jgi:hypothetical protein